MADGSFRVDDDDDALNLLQVDPFSGLNPPTLYTTSGRAHWQSFAIPLFALQLCR